MRYWGLTDRGPLRGGPRRGGTDAGSLPTSQVTPVEEPLAQPGASLPTTLFIDEEGYIFAYKNGMVEKETLDEILDMMLAE